MRKFIAKSLGYPLQDWVKGTDILREKDFLLRSQNWSRDFLYSYRLNKLKNLVEFSYENVPYYKNLFKTRGILPADIKDLDDLKIIPILNKETALLENNNLFATVPFTKLKIGKTGGTSGTPLLIKSNTDARSIVWGAYYRWYEWLGIELGDPIVTMWGATTVISNSIARNIKEKVLFYLQNNLRINSFEMNNKTLPFLLKEIKEKKPKIIKGYLSALLQLADYIEENNIRDIETKAISSTSETLYPHFRTYLEKVFKAKIYDQYGCGECQSVAYECKAQRGMHITEEHVIVEVLDQNNNSIINENGRIVITDLDNYAMPFIRYENGDTGYLLNGRCSCGIEHQMIGGIVGRTADTIILKDCSKVHGVYFTDIVYEIDPEESRKIKRFQAFQDNSGEIEFRIEKSEELNSEFLNKIDQALKKDFRISKIVFMDKIPNEKSGKFKYVKSTVQ